MPGCGLDSGQTLDRLHVYSRVVRGPKWRYGGEDGYGEGRVHSMLHSVFDHTVWVLWDNGYKELGDGYKTNRFGRFDVKLSAADCAENTGLDERLFQDLAVSGRCYLIHNPTAA